MTRIAVAALILLAFSSPAAIAAEIVVHDEKSYPESMAVAPDGTVYAGSASSPFVYRVKKGAASAETFIDATAEGPGTSFLGQLVDGNTLWSCQLTPAAAPTAGAPPPPRRSVLRGFDLASGKEKLRWPFPGDNSICNDMSVGVDKALYVSDTANAKIYRLAPGAQAAELYMENGLLNGIDGLTFLDGVLYANNVRFNKLYRIPVDAAGKPGSPVDIWMDAPVRGPDGMRAASGKIFIAANGTGQIVSVTVTGDTGHVVVLKDGLKTPTGIEPAGGTLWFTERGTGKIMSVPLPQ
jgi:sugar lactone lactonase YvrE